MGNKKLVMIAVRKKSESCFKIKKIGQSIDKIPIASLVNIGIAGKKGAEAGKKLYEEMIKNGRK